MFDYSTEDTLFHEVVREGAAERPERATMDDKFCYFHNSAVARDNNSSYPIDGCVVEQWNSGFCDV